MKKSILLLTLLLGWLAVANSQTLCSNDRVDYVAYKNTPNPATGVYTLTTLLPSSISKASQTYYYSGQGRITEVRIYGDYPGVLFGAPLRIGIYNVGPNNRPTTPVAPPFTDIFWVSYNSTGYHDFVIPGGGVNVSGNFAVVVEVLPGSFPTTGTFDIDFNGSGEGRGEDLASLAGTSTGQNWISFSQDADFFLVPRIRHTNLPTFTASTNCIWTGGSVSFNSNASIFSADSMFNVIGLDNYSGSNTYYNWDFGDGNTSTMANPTHTYSSAGQYTVELTTTIEGWNTTCQRSYTMDVSVGLSLSASGMMLDCYGDSDGASSATTTGGASPYQYSLTGNLGDYHSNGGNFTGLTAGSYTMYVKDALGCVSTDGFTITQPTQLVFGSPTTTNATCGDSTGAFQISATGGSGSLEYSTNMSNWQSSGNFSDLPSGSYTVYVRDANGCVASTQVAINDQGGPSIVFYTNQNVSCNGGNDGSITVFASGGSGALEYSIDGGANWQSTATFNNLTAGSYVVTVKDAAQCVVNTPSIIVTQPPALTISAVVQQNVSCNGGSNGSIQVTASTGGSGSHSFSIDGTNYFSTTTFSNLQAGNYTVYVRDVAGCTATTSVTVTEPAPLVAQSVPVSVTCPGGADGEILLGASGGTPPYQYRYKDGPIWSPWFSSGDFSNLQADTYQLMIMDANGCTTSKLETVTQPAPITLPTLVVGNTACGDSNATVTVAAAGGTAPYEYSIDGGMSWQTGNPVVYTDLPAGGHVILVQDDAGCLRAVSITIANSAGPVITSASHTDATCYGGSDGTINNINYTGGTGTIEFSIDLVNWEDASGFSAFTGLPADTHRVYIRDANNCLNFYDVVVGEGPEIVISNIAITDNDCNGAAEGTVTVSASGGTGTLEYSLDGTNYQGSSTFTGLAAGEYIVYVKDVGGCVNTDRFQIDEPDAIDISLGILNVAPCNGDGNGGIFISAGGGAGGYQYSLDGTNYQSTNLFNNLDGGEYTVYVRDASGCVNSKVAMVEEPDLLTLMTLTTDVSCYGGNDGAIDLSVYGGATPYKYNWGEGEISEDRVNIDAGDYTVTVTDGNGCVKTTTVNIDEPANAISINGMVTDVSSQGADDGAVDVTVTGGTPPYSYYWSSGDYTEDINELEEGLYLLTVIDDNDCEAFSAFPVDFATGITPEQAAQSLQVYPNPTTNMLNVQADGLTFEEVRILDIVGKVVYENLGETNNLKVDVSRFEAGSYIMQIVVDGTPVNKRIEIIR